jgi:hypothetical protein
LPRVPERLLSHRHPFGDVRSARSARSSSMRATEIPIASPCGADWSTMKPSDKTRFCDACKKHVHDLSAMTSTDARALLASPPTEGLCVRFLYDAHGDIVFRDAPLPVGMLSRAKRLAAAAVALPMALAACSSPMNGRPEPRTTIGAVERVLPPPNPSASASASAIEPVMSAPPPPQRETR